MTETAQTTANLDTLVRKLEMQKKQLELEVRFNNNMALFKAVAPAIYNQYSNYQPEELRLSYDKDGHVNLVNYKLDNKPVYAYDPEAFCTEQVDNYLKNPGASCISFQKAQIMNEEHIHVHLINHLIERYENIGPPPRLNPKVPVGMMLLTGCGLGYHIAELVKHMDIHNLCIFDPHKDSFYASLHVIDWTPIIEYFYREGRMLKLYIGMTAFDAMADLKLLTDKIGLHNLVYTFMYRHFNSKYEAEFIDKYKKEFHLNACGTGFFDDEQVSFAHTIASLNNKVKLFRPQPAGDALPPVFVIGNGPSLDGFLDTIRAHRDSAILISCGTALGSLCKAGIKPDFHIEMERNINIRDWILQGTTAEFRAGIMLLALNTGAPGVLELFDETALAKKPNDLGEAIIDREIGKKAIPSLQLCNPTVTNAGLSYAIGLGFSDIYLLGVDLGMSENMHHSKLSLYYDLEKKTKKTGHTPLDNKNIQYQVKGNFCDTVTSNPIFDASRVNMELLLSCRPQVKCYNPNNGAFIEGAITVKPEALQIPGESVDKQAVVARLKQQHFVTPQVPELTDDYVKDHYLKAFFDIRKELNLKKNIEDPFELHRELNRVYLRVKNLRDTEPVTTMLLRGSLHGYFTLIHKHCLFCPTPAAFKKAYQIGRQAYMRFLKQAYRFMRETPLKLDNTTDKVVVQLNDGDN
ncbi:motility associated factor glycosyltransferase family protein [Exilibacterium tricleocarpae]|uniref:Motility associated factor glycosyltransferase family protein n=1 Tax=Exilibacterium tricleocarpae TaxID=2591008 RepID=A0A545U3X8_9GAMM|nr:6-hydroxymethylpterin diphosphokinase MptE-like protein [Exilibacterium tricleocarpae]TQV84154.1 motility associated factor glycosyltransferase family protein [Exilibacterium tricleocarpae]